MQEENVTLNEMGFNDAECIIYHQIQKDLGEACRLVDLMIQVMECEND